MKNIFLMLALFLGVNFFSGCNKDDDDHHNHDEVTITISSPEENAVYMGGQEVVITAEATADFTLHGYDIYIIDPSHGNDTLYHKHAHTHGSVLPIEGSWTNNVNHHKDLELQIVVHKSHHGDDKEIVKRMFHCHPM